MVTEATMRLVPKPQASAVALLYFASWHEAVDAVLEASPGGGLAIEAMDHTVLAFVRSDRPDLRDLIPERFEAGPLVEFGGRGHEEARTGSRSRSGSPRARGRCSTFFARATCGHASGRPPGACAGRRCRWSTAPSRSSGR